MKKFISMVMAAAMVVSLVPATAFAATGRVVADEEAYIVDAWEKVEDFKGVGGVEGYVHYDGAPELQIDIDSIDLMAANGNGTFEQDIVIEIENADFVDGTATKLEELDEDVAKAAMKGCFNVTPAGSAEVTVTEVDNNTVEATITGSTTALTKIAFDLSVIVDDTDAGEVATVSVTSDIVGASVEDLVFVEILEEGIEVVLKETADVAEEETTVLEKKMEIKANVDKFAAGQMIKLELSNGFEFVAVDTDMTDKDGKALATGISKIEKDKDDDDVLWLTAQNVSKIVLQPGLFEIDAVDAKVGDICTITVEAEGCHGDTEGDG